MVHCDVNYHLGFRFSAEWLRVQAVWIMCLAFLMVAHNFTDQWALSIVVKKKKEVEFVMRPNSIFHSHCSARTRPFESHCAAKYHLSNTRHLSVGVVSQTTCLLFLVFASPHHWDTESVQLTKVEIPTKQRPKPWGPQQKLLCVNWFVLIYLLLYWGNKLHQNTEQRDNGGCEVKGIVGHFV